VRVLDRRRIVGQLRVQEIFLSGGRWSWTILWPEFLLIDPGDVRLEDIYLHAE
jgi:hypothetical protein